MSRCYRRGCERPAARVEAAKDGEIVAAADSCAECFEEDMAGFRALQQEFADLLAAGVSREAANEFLIAKTNGAKSA